MGRRKRVARFLLTTGLSLEGEQVRRWRTRLTGEYTLVAARQEVVGAHGSKWAPVAGVQKIPTGSVAYYTQLLA